MTTMNIFEAPPPVPGGASPEQKYTLLACKSYLEHRYTYHQPQGDQADRYASIRAKVLELALHLSDRAPASRELSTALTHLDAVMFYANAAIARNER